MRDNSVKELFSTERFEEMYAAKDHKIRLSIGDIDFRSVCEDHVFYDEAGEKEAVIHTISYIRTGGGKNRPVMFVWNGGPGSATSALHLECFGPFLLEKDEKGSFVYGLTEDKECILDICDLVYVDAVGVGYSRLLAPEKWDKYYCLDGDGRSNAFVIVNWLKRHDRWNSPLYLCGESYGTTRVCRILEELGRNPIAGNRMLLGLPVKGVILIGLALSVDNSGKTIDERLDLLTAALPTMAAVHWYHHLQGRCARNEFIEEAWRFAGEELLPVLFKGENCPQDTIQKTAERLAYFTGMEAEYFIRTGLKLMSMDDFMTKVAADKGLRVNLFDGRKAVPLAGSYNAVGDDNTTLRVVNGLLAEKLAVNTERLYYTGNTNINFGWNFESEEPPEYRKSNVQCLKESMQRMPEMRVLTASGIFDLCTLMGNTRYVLSHSGLPKENLTEREYPGGHGVYSSAEGKKAFLQDIRVMLETEERKGDRK